MPSSQHSVLARILGWLGLLSALLSRRSSASAAPVVPPFARSSAETAPPIASPSGSRTRGSEVRQRQPRRSSSLPARLAAVAKLNQPTARARPSVPRVIPAAKPIAKRALMQPKRRNAPASFVRAPRKTANNVVSFRPLPPLVFDRAA